MIPERFRTECVYCHDPLDTRRAGVHQYQEGWIEHRRSGGAHAIRNAVKHQRYACRWCVDKLVRHGGADQMTLL